MSHRLLITGLLLLVSALGNATAFADDAAPKASGNANAKQAKAIFEKIKSLSGEWVHAKGEAKGLAALSVRVIAGGSAVLQREFPGTPMEMVTVYHLDGDEVMLNHYCVLGNQPRLKATMGDQQDTIVFSFVSATGLASKNDPHMHQGRMRFLNKDTIKSTWTKFVDDKAAEEHTFELTRKKKARRDEAE